METIIPPKAQKHLRVFENVCRTTQKSNLKEYYQNCGLWLPDRPQDRYFIFKLQDGTFKRFHLKNETELRKLLIKYRPFIVYYSAGAWNNVQNVRGVKTTSYPIAIFEDLILDIDNDNSINEARKSSLKIIKRIGNPDYILMTRRGFHLTYYKQGNKKKEILEKLKDIKDLDKKCTQNDFNVFTLPYTLTKDGKRTTIINSEMLEFLPTKTLKKLQKQIYTPQVITPEKPDKKANEEADKTLQTRVLKQTKSFRSKDGADKRGSGVTILSFNNKIKNNLFIPILIYNKNLKGLKRELTYLTENYDLGNLYVFKKENYYCFISLKAMDKRRLNKILNSSRSITKDQFKKFKKVWFNFSEWTPLIKITATPNKFFRVSKKHYEALIKIGFSKSKQINELVGKTPLQVYEVGLS